MTELGPFYPNATGDGLTTNVSAAVSGPLRLMEIARGELRQQGCLFILYRPIRSIDAAIYMG